MFKTLLLSICMFFSIMGVAQADVQASNGSDTIVLHKKACSLPAMEALVAQPAQRAQFYSGEAWIAK